MVGLGTVPSPSVGALADEDLADVGPKHNTDDAPGAPAERSDPDPPTGLSGPEGQPTGQARMPKPGRTRWLVQRITGHEPSISFGSNVRCLDVGLYHLMRECRVRRFGPPLSGHRGYTALETLTSKEPMLRGSVPRSKGEVRF